MPDPSLMTSASLIWDEMITMVKIPAIYGVVFYGAWFVIKYMKEFPSFGAKLNIFLTITVPTIAALYFRYESEKPTKGDGSNTVFVESASLSAHPLESAIASALVMFIGLVACAILAQPKFTQETMDRINSRRFPIT